MKVHTYVKCGKLETSRNLFNSMEETDVILWNVVILNYGMHGYVVSAIEIIQLMEESNIKPSTAYLFLSLLSACNNTGNVIQGRCLFDRMQKYGVKSSQNGKKVRSSLVLNLLPLVMYTFSCRITMLSAIYLCS